jgi:putative oxidoreductase
MFDAIAKNTLVPLILRLALAAVFTVHGAALIDHGWGATWMNDFSLPDPAPGPLQMAVAWAQLIGGIAMLLGFLTRVAAIGLIAVMVGAIMKVHLPHGFNIQKNGYEYNVVLIAVCLALVLTGPGHIAVDRFFRLKPKA